MASSTAFVSPAAASNRANGAHADANSTRYTISELAEEFSLTTRAIRFYEDQGLIHPLRDGQRRVYGQGDRVRLRLIQRGKRMGFSLNEISEILDMYDADGEAHQLRYFIERIAERRAQLNSQRDDIDNTLADLDAIEQRCRDRLIDVDTPMDQHVGVRQDGTST